MGFFGFTLEAGFRVFGILRVARDATQLKGGKVRALGFRSLDVLGKGICT